MNLIERAAIALQWPGLHALAHINVPPPAPPGPYAPAEEPPITVPTPEGTPPEIDEPAPEPMIPVREPGIIRPPQAAGGAATWLH